MEQHVLLLLRQFIIVMCVHISQSVNFFFYRSDRFAFTKDTDIREEAENVCSILLFSGGVGMPALPLNKPAVSPFSDTKQYN